MFLALSAVKAKYGLICSVLADYHPIPSVRRSGGWACGDALTRSAQQTRRGGARGGSPVPGVLLRRIRRALSGVSQRDANYYRWTRLLVCFLLMILMTLLLLHSVSSGLSARSGLERPWHWDRPGLDSKGGTLLLQWGLSTVASTQTPAPGLDSRGVFFKYLFILIIYMWHLTYFILYIL